MTTNDIEQFLRAFWTSDWAVCAAALADDATYEDPLLPEPVIGREAILEILHLCHAWADLQPRLRSLFGDGTHFCAELRVAGTITAPADGIPDHALGRSFDFAETDVFEAANGRIVRMSIYADVPALMSQIGA